MSSINKVVLMGHLGNDPDIRRMQNGGESCTLSIATSENWKDKTTGEKKASTQWHRVVIFNEGIIRICREHLSKGDKVYLEGQQITRKYQKNGEDRYVTEVRIQGYKAEFKIISCASWQNQDSGHSQNIDQTPAPDVFEDDIPF